MARSEARISVDIWSDDEFLALDEGEQRAFMFVISQIDLAHDGVIPLRMPRWARKARGLSVEQMQQRIAGLAANRFVVADYEAGELLVRSFIRRDKVYRQPNVLRAAADHLPMVESATIRRELAVEIQRILTLDDVHKDCLPILEAMLAELAPDGITAAQNPQGNPSDNPSAGTPGERGELQTVPTQFPVPRDLDPLPPAGNSAGNPLTRVGAREEPPGPPGRVEALLAEWRSRHRRPVGSVVAAVGMWIHDAVRDHATDDEIRETLRRWDAIDRKGPGLLPSLLHEVANAPIPSNVLALPTSRASPSRPSTTDRAVADTLALADRIEAGGFP
jgi:hypothetical protein